MTTSTAQTCRVCGSAQLVLDYTLGNQAEFEYYRCQNCRLVVYDMSAGLDQTQYEYAFIDPRVDQPGFSKIDQTYAFLRGRGIPTGRLLDIGSGVGRLLALAQRDGWDVIGIDLSEAMARSSSEALGVDVHAMNFLDGDIEELGQFDVVILAHVLEHLPDPVDAMKRIASLIKPGGFGVLEFPNIDAIESRFQRAIVAAHIRRKKFPEGWCPGHCQEFCRNSFQFLVEKTGFQLDVWETYSSRPMRSRLYRTLGIGNKARVLIRRR